MMVVKQTVIEAVLEYYKDPFLFELKCIWETTYKDYPSEWKEIFDQGGGLRNDDCRRAP